MNTLNTVNTLNTLSILSTLNPLNTEYYKETHLDITTQDTDFKC